MQVSFKDILEAFEFASAWLVVANEMQAYLCKQTGKIYVHSDLYEDPEEELPEDLEDGEKYIALPDKYDLDLGTALVFNFASEVLPHDYDAIRKHIQQARRLPEVQGAAGRGEMPSIAGMISRRKRLSGRCATGARPTR